MNFYLDKLIKTILLAFIFTSGLFSQAYPQKSQNDLLLIGTWSLDFDRSIDITDASAKAMVDTLRQDHLNEIKTSFDARKITFDSSGKYTLTLGQGHNPVEGRWELGNDKKTLSISVNDNQYTQKIISIDQSKLILDLNDKSPNKLFSKWYMLKDQN